MELPEGLFADSPIHESTANTAEHWTTGSCKERWIELVWHLVSKSVSYRVFQGAVLQILRLFLSLHPSGLSVSMEAFLAGGSIDYRFHSFSHVEAVETATRPLRTALGR